MQNTAVLSIIIDGLNGHKVVIVLYMKKLKGV